MAGTIEAGGTIGGTPRDEPLLPSAACQSGPCPTPQDPASRGWCWSSVTGEPGIILAPALLCGCHQYGDPDVQMRSTPCSVASQTQSHNSPTRSSDDGAPNPVFPCSNATSICGKEAVSCFSIETYFMSVKFTLAQRLCGGRHVHFLVYLLKLYLVPNHHYLTPEHFCCPNHYPKSTVSDTLAHPSTPLRLDSYQATFCGCRLTSSRAFPVLEPMVFYMIDTAFL